MDYLPAVNAQPAIQAERLPLRPFFEQIIDKKVNQVALTHFEKIVDFFCTYLYRAYNERLAFRINQIKLPEAPPVPRAPLDPVPELAPAEGNPAPNVQEIAGIVHRFADGAPLFDQTFTHRAGIERPKLFNLLEGKEYLGHDEIIIDGKPVAFDPTLRGDLLFGQNYGTKHAIVADVKGCEELVMIYERETDGQLKAWSVDTTRPTQKVIMGGQLEIGQPKEIFIALEVHPLPRPDRVDVPLMG